MPYHPRDYDLSPRQIELLEAIGDDAVQRAAEATGRLLGVNLPMSAVRARGVPAQEIADLVGDPEALTVAIYLEVEGSAPGHAAFICSRAQALRLVDLLMGQEPGTTTDLDELGTSALQELGNILTSSYLTALSDHTGLTFLPTPPQIAVDMAYALVSAILVGSTEGQSEAITVVTEFNPFVGPLQGHFLYIPAASGLSELLECLEEAA